MDSDTKLAQIEQHCLAVKKDTSEVRWVRIFATELLKIIDADEDWNAVAYHGKLREGALMASVYGITEAEIEALLAVATLYVDAFKEDEMMSLPEKLRLQEIEDILKRHGRYH